MTQSVHLQPLVSIVILTRGKADLLDACLKSIYDISDGSLPMETIVVEHESTDAKKYLEEHKHECRYLRMEDKPEKQSFSSLNNAGAKMAKGKYIVLMNNDVELTKGCLDEMLAVMRAKQDVGIVGAKLLFPDGDIQHMGVVFNGYGIPGHLGWKRPNDESFPPSQRSDYNDAVTFALVMIRKGVWDLLNGLDTDYFFNYEDTDFCLRAAEHKWRCYVSHMAVAIHKEGQSTDYRKTEDHTVKRNLVVFRNKWIFNGRIEKILPMKVEREIGPLQYERLNVAFLPGGKGSGISWWRMEIPGRMLVKKGMANIEFVYSDRAEESTMKTIENAHVAVWQSFFNDPVKRIAQLGSARPFKMIYEYDDHPIYLSPFAQAYKGLGTKEYSLKARDGSSIWLWRDGSDGFNLEENRRNRQRHLEIMSLVDGMTTTTEALAQYFRTLNEEVTVLPNCIDFDRYSAPLFELWDRKPGPVRIGWWGGDNHWHDIASIGPWLKDFVNAHDVKLVVIGSLYKGPLRGIDMNKVEEHEWVHCEAFPWKLATTAMDIAVVPLASPVIPEMKFNDYKSDIKWLEASAYKIPCLVQGGVRPYEHCEDNVNAMVYLTEHEFKEKLETLVKDADTRKRIGEAAHDHIREYRDIEKELHRWLEFYDRMWKKPWPEYTIDDVPDALLRPAASNAVEELSHG